MKLMYLSTQLLSKSEYSRRGILLCQAQTEMLLVGCVNTNTATSSIYIVLKFIIVEIISQCNQWQHFTSVGVVTTVWSA